MKIRKITKEDLSEVNKLIRELHIEIANFVGKKLTEEELKEEEIKEDELDNVLVAEVGGEIMGYVSFDTEEKPDEWYGNHIYVCEIYVKPDMRGKGISDKLMEAVIDKAKKLNVNLKIDTFVNNKKAIKFFEKHGFEPLEIYFIKKNK